MDCFISHFRLFFILVKTSETDTEYEIYAELPGINKEQIGIDVFERSITITVQALEDVTRRR